MDTSQLSSHCIELLRTHNRVSLGSMGSFMAEDTPATLTKNGHILLPPGRRIFFRESETWNDGLLEEAYGEKEELGLCFLIFPKSWPGRNRLHCTVSGSLGKRAREMFFLSWIRTSLSIQMVSGWFPCPCVRCSSLPRSGAICQKTRLRPQSCRSRKHRTNRFKEQRMDRPYPWQIRFHKKQP